MNPILASLAMLAVAHAHRVHPQEIGTPPGGPIVPLHAGTPYSPDPSGVTISIGGPSTVTIPSSQDQSDLFSLDLTVGDVDTWQVNMYGQITYETHGTAGSVGIIETNNNGYVGSGDNRAQILKETTRTQSSVSDPSITYNYNYHAQRVNASYPIECLMQYQAFDNTPSGPVAGDSTSWRIHDTNAPGVSKIVTVKLS